MPLSLPQTIELLFTGQSLTNYLLDLNAQGYIAAMYLADVASQATYTGTFAGTILRNAGYTSGPGAELVTNGGFDTDLTGWVNNGTPSTNEWAAGRDHVIGGGANNGTKQTVAAGTLGDTYRYKYDYQVVSGTMAVIAGNAGNYTTTHTGTGSVTAYFIVNNTALNPIFFQNGATNCEFYIDNVSLTKVGQLDAAIGGTTPWLAAGGLSFDGLTSYLKILNNAALANLTGQAFIYIGTPSSLGEANAGSWFYWADGASPNMWMRFNNTNRVIGAVYTNATNASLTSDNNEVDWIGSPAVWAGVYDDANVLGAGRIISYRRGLNGSIKTLAGTPTAGTGTKQNATGDLYLLNRLANDTTYAGTIKKIIIVNGTAINTINTILQNLTALAGV